MFSVSLLDAASFAGRHALTVYGVLLLVVIVQLLYIRRVEVR